MWWGVPERRSGSNKWGVDESRESGVGSRESGVGNRESGVGSRESGDCLSPAPLLPE
ncbi:AraC family transcriptional regulator [Spirulina subsalsa]|uniref:AraC family transcriptional regulator n=1 Tax=Spirulina subsalsa TaxID=54311 RepID=UPI0013DFA7FC|nr:AraC family transcriptional regulator [Spirulina subsalsa]